MNEHLSFLHIQGSKGFFILFLFANEFHLSLTILALYHPSITNKTTDQSLEFHLVLLNSLTQLMC